MAIHFVCPYGHRLKAADHRAGKKGRCPTCHQRVIVPVANPIPSGREKREWDAGRPNSIELDESPAPTTEAASATTSNLPEVVEAAALAAASPLPPVSAPIIADIELPECFTPTSKNSSPAPQEERPPAPLAAASVPVIPPPPPPSPPLPPAVSSPALPASAPAIPPPFPPLSTPGTPWAESAAPLAAQDAAAESLPGFPTAAVAESEVPVATQRKPRWIAWADEEGARRAYRAKPQQIEIAYWLAVVLLFVIVFAAAPSLAFLQIDQAPAWAQLMLLIAGVQLAYAIWLSIVPDWSSVRIGMWVFGVSAALYAAGAGLFATASPTSPPLGIASSAASASGWCGAIVLVLGLLSYACGQVSSSWRKASRQQVQP